MVQTAVQRSLVFILLSLFILCLDVIMCRVQMLCDCDVQFPCRAIPAGAESTNGLDVDRHDARHFQLATNGRHLCQYLCAQVCSLAREGTLDVFHPLSAFLSVSATVLTVHDPSLTLTQFCAV